MLKRLVLVPIFLIIFFSSSPKKVNAQYPTPTPMGTCAGWTNCHVVVNTQCTGCGLYESDTYTECNEGICNAGCKPDTSCLPSNPCAAMVGCYWVSDASCGGGTCGCGESRTAVQYCDGPTGPVHCNDQCSGISSCCVGCTGSCNNTTDPTPTPPPDTRNSPYAVSF